MGPALRNPEPFVALMRRYIVDYTSRHDTSVCAEIMEPDYTLRMGEHVLSGRDDLYVPAAQKQFAQFPGLGITVHRIVTNGDRLALHFSEHGASTEHDWAQASWAGIGIYRWNGQRLVENFVEQDYLSRRRQLAGGSPTAVDSPAVAPWDTRAIAADPDAEQATRQWLEDGLRGDTVRVDDASPRLALDVDHVVIDDIFSAGPTVAFRVRLHGAYVGGLTELDGREGTLATLHATGIVIVTDAQVASGQVVTDRLGTMRSIQRTATD